MIKLSNIFFFKLKDAIFITSNLGTASVDSWKGAMEFIWGWNIFQKFLKVDMERKFLFSDMIVQAKLETRLSTVS